MYVADFLRSHLGCTPAVLRLVRQTFDQTTPEIPVKHRMLYTLTALLSASVSLRAQSMPGMEMPKPQPTTISSEQVSNDPPPPMSMQQPTALIDNIVQHTSSGTSIEPASTPMAMMMGQRRGWTLMLHGTAFISDIQQHADSGRGKNKLFSTNMIMPMAQHRLGPGTLTLRAMLSLEPATVTGRFYPELFQQGETAYNKPIRDGQHPHDFVMELGALYDLPLGEHTLLSLYAAPVGDPAIGPTAYPHRLSASEDPIAALGHHQEDSTHIAFNVVTAGLTYKSLRGEVSGFHGAEPTEARWHLQPSPNGVTPDSYSGRITWAPTANLSAQYSIAHLTGPESLVPSDDETRQTASVMYNRPIGAGADTTSMPGMTMGTPATGNWATTLIWGQAKALPSNVIGNSYLVESLLRLRRNAYWTRIEVAARTSELLTPAPAVEGTVGHVQAYTVGFDRSYRVLPHLEAAPGVQLTAYRTPDPLAKTYGRAPFGAVMFLRLRIK